MKRGITMNPHLTPPGFPQPQTASVASAPAAAPQGATHANLADILEPAIWALEIERKRALDELKSKGKLAAMVAGALFIGGLIVNAPVPFLLFLPIAAVFMIYGLAYNNAQKQYADGFKNLVIPHVIAAVNPTLAYSPRDYISENEFRMCQLFRSPDRYRGEDMVQGSVGATRIRFSEVHAEEKHERTDSKGHRRTEYVTLFKGLFFIADFNKEFKGITFVLPDTTEKLFGKFGQSLQALGARFSFGQRELVKLEDPEFEKNFVVYSRDQVEARYLLSTSLMRRLLDFRAKCGHPFHLAFIANQIYMAVPLRENIFEPPALSKPLDASCAATYINQLQFILDIVEDLDLNTRIWSMSAPAGTQKNTPFTPQGTAPQQQDTGIHVWANP